MGRGNLLVVFFFVASLALGCPAVLPGTLPLYVADPVPPTKPGEHPGFACFGACGPSCACVRRQDEIRRARIAGEECRYRVIRCSTNSFCRWHDSCYRQCDFAFPGNLDARAQCYRKCDLGCLTGLAPAGVPGAAKLGALPGGPHTWRECAALLRGAFGDHSQGSYEPRPLVYSELTPVRH